MQAIPLSKAKSVSSITRTARSSRKDKASTKLRSRNYFFKPSPAKSKTVGQEAPYISGKLKVLIALKAGEQALQPAITEEQRRHAFLYGLDLPPAKVSTALRDLIVSKLRANQQFQEVEIDFCSPAECKAKLEAATKSKHASPYNLVITENPEPEQLISTTSLARPLRQVSPKTFVMHYDRKSMNYSYTYREPDTINRGYDILRAKDLEDIDSKLEKTIGAYPQRILYIGPKDTQFRRRVYRTVFNEFINGSNTQFDSLNDYSLINVLQTVRAAKEEGKAFTKIVIEENSWNPNEKQLAERLAFEFEDESEVYLFPTNKYSRKQRLEQLEADETSAVKTLNFDNLAIRGKTATHTSQALDAATKSPRLDEILFKTRQRAGDMSLSDEAAMASNFFWEPVHDIYPSRFYMSYGDAMASLKLSGMLDCFCSEYYATPHVNGGGTYHSSNLAELKKGMLKMLDKNLFFDVIFLDYDKMGQYSKVKELVEKLSPHTKVIVNVSNISRSLKKLSPEMLRIAKELFGPYARINSMEQIEQMTVKRAEELRAQGIPASADIELFTTPGMNEFNDSRGRPRHHGEDMDSILSSHIDYN